MSFFKPCGHTSLEHGEPRETAQGLWVAKRLVSPWGKVANPCIAHSGGPEECKEPGPTSP